MMGKVEFVTILGTVVWIRMEVHVCKCVSFKCRLISRQNHIRHIYLRWWEYTSCLWTNAAADWLYQLFQILWFNNRPCVVLILPHDSFAIYWIYIEAGKWVINSSPPSAAYMRQWIVSALVQIMACRLFGAKLLYKPMLGYCQLDP